MGTSRRAVSWGFAGCLLILSLLLTLAAAAQGKDGAQAWGWGKNDDGQVGDGSTDQRNGPVQVSNMTDAVSIGGGRKHSLVSRADKTVWAWGNNDNGRLGDGTTDPSPTPIQVTGLTNVDAIAAGDDFSLALKGDKTVWTWGDNEWGQLGDGTTDDRHAPVPVTSLTGVKDITGGYEFSLALKEDGTVWGWGANYRGQLGTGDTSSREKTPVRVGTLTGIVAIAVGATHGLALKNDGTVWAWGRNNSGQLGDGTNVQRETPVQVSGLTDVVEIAAHYEHSMARLEDGFVWAWGDGSHGQLGDGTRTDRWEPVKVINIADITKIACGSNYSLAVKGDGTLWGWGRNTDGQLGLGNTSQGQWDYPVLSVVYRDPEVLEAGNWHSLALGGRIPDCQVTCTADVSPTTGFFPLQVSFFATATATDCITGPEYHWSSGNGDESDEQNTDFTYTRAGTYTWNLTVTVDGQTCTQTGTITVSDPVCVLTCDATAAPTSGQVPLEVTFSATSTTLNCTGEPTYYWQFGEGDVFTGKDVTHTYDSPDTYTWSMTASVDGETCIKTGSIVVLGPPCDLTCFGLAGPNTGPWPLEVQFQGSANPVNCQGDPTYFWEFGDGTTSAEQNPVYTYPAAGVYTWELTVTIDGRTCTTSSTVNVTEHCSVTCSAVVTNPSGQAPWTVSFEGNSTSTNCSGQTNYHWDFGDGQSVNNQSPDHTYTTAGTYTWILTVTQDTDTCTQTGSVDILLPDCLLSCSATAAPVSGEAPLAVAFTGSATAENCIGTPVFHWQFGDGRSSTQQNPTHTYDVRGDYTWILTVDVDDQSCVQTGVISVSGPPCVVTCEASASPLCGIAPMTVSFSGSATATDCIMPPAYFWEFGDGEVSPDLNPEHTYQVQGEYEWTFTVFVEDEICTITGSILVTLDGVGCLPGDCDLNGTVTIGEVQKVIRMHLRLDPVGCGADCNGDGIISIGELQKVINAHLRIPSSC